MPAEACVRCRKRPRFTVVCEFCHKGTLRRSDTVAPWPRLLACCRSAKTVAEVGAKSNKLPTANLEKSYQQVINMFDFVQVSATFFSFRDL